MRQKVLAITRVVVMVGDLEWFGLLLMSLVLVSNS